MLAYDTFRPAARSRAQQRPTWTPGEDALPALYLSHGAPPLLQDTAWMQQLGDWADALPNPRAILIVSAHWETAPLSITSTAAGMPLVYDFSGFDPQYSRMRYDTPDATALRDAVLAVLPDGTTVHEHRSRGLDHGAWVPLLVMYPRADIPVLQLSMPTQDPAALLAIGQRLRPLREQGVLVVGSGFMTHGLPFLTPQMFYGNEVPSWSADFDAWAAEALAAGDLDALAGYRSRAPGLPYAHPTPEHFTPLFVTLGAADGVPATRVDGYAFGLSKRSVQVA